MTASVPSYLHDYTDLFASDPRGAALQWFREAHFGLFLHYGLYSLLGRHEWVQYREKIHVDEYAKLVEKFTAVMFDAGEIADLAVAAGMRYVNITARHHDSFCLFHSRETDFNSVKAENCGRDLIRELAEACDKRGLGLCLYYSHGRDWRHSHAPNNDQYGGSARPEYDEPEPHYAIGDDHDLQKYLDFMSAQLTELLTEYGPIANIWLDGIGVPLRPKDENGSVIEGYDPAHDGDPFKCQELYDLIHSLQPQVLVSYKQGYLGTEDFYAPERGTAKISRKRGDKPAEICTTLQRKGWGYMLSERGNHLTPAEVWEGLTAAGAADCNLLPSTGLLGRGSIDAQDETTLRAIGKRIRDQGYPGRG